MAGRYKSYVDTDPFGDDVVYAWVMTTRTQREAVIEDWENGRKKYHKDIAALLHLDQNALLLACFLEFEHPSVCQANGKPLANHYGKLLALMLKHVDNCSKSVDNSLETVDKFVESPVDEKGTYPQGHGYPQAFFDGAIDLSTYPQFIHNPPVDKFV